MSGECKRSVGTDGIRGEDHHGSTLRERGRIVIGADGHHSPVARAVEAPKYHRRPAVACNYSTYWSGVTKDGLVNVFVAWLNSEFHAHRHDRDERYMRTVGSAPQLAERVRAGKREERFYRTTDLPGFLRKPYGPGWALVGDASYHRLPLRQPE